MSRTSRIAAVGVVCWACWGLPVGALWSQEAEAPKAVTPAEVEVLFSDGGAMKVRLTAENLKLVSPYGPLTIPVVEIQSIEFATRLTPEVEKRIKAAIERLGAEEFEVREQAEAELLALKQAGFPALQRAAREGEAEVAHRAEKLLAQLRQNLSEETLKPREFDVVQTIHSRLAGKLDVEALEVSTEQFGPLSIKLPHLVRMTLGGVAPEGPPTNVQPNPGSLSAFQNKIGESFNFEVTGANSGSVYGTDVYTTDSNLATAAVHCGKLQVGETAIVTVKMLPSPPAFTGSVQHGISSNSWGVYPAAYQIVRVYRGKSG